MPISQDPEKIPKARGWFVQSVFENPNYGTDFLNTLKELSQDIDLAGCSDVGVRNMLFSLILSLRPEAVLEVGAHIGSASVIMGQALKVNNYGKLICLEPQHVFFKKLTSYVQAAGLASFVESIQGTGDDPAVLSRLERQGPFDLIFLDARHDYSAVVEDIGRCWQLLNENGVIIFHDCSFIAQRSDEERLGGVRRALVEASRDYPDFKPIFFEYPMWLNDCGAAMACKQRIDWKKPGQQGVATSDDGMPHEVQRVAQTEATGHLNEFWGDMKAVQTFRCHVPICRIDIMFATFMRQNTCDIIFELFEGDERGRLLVKQTVNASKLVDNAYYSFMFDPIRSSVGDKYSIRLSSPTSSVNDCVTVRTSGGKTLHQDELRLNGNRLERDMTFKVFTRISA